MRIFLTALLCQFFLFSTCEAQKKKLKKTKKVNQQLNVKLINKGLSLNNQWILESIEKNFNTLKSINKKSFITIKNNTKFSGNAGCNSIGGDVNVKSNTIKFSNIIRTEMFCDNMPQEDLFLVLLEKANHYKIVGGELFLYDNSFLLMTLESFR